MEPLRDLLQRIDPCDPATASQLLPLVYQELRTLAAAKLAHERPGQTFSATALVHEAYLRLVGGQDKSHWNGRGHFFAAAAEAMRRILVENARRKQRIRHGGGKDRQELVDIVAPIAAPPEELLAVHEALDELARCSPDVAQLVKLHYFAGLTIEQCAATLGIAERSAYRDWSYAKAWLHKRLAGPTR